MRRHRRRAAGGSHARLAERGHELRQILSAMRELARSPWTPTDLAELLGCSERTVRRYVVAITAAGVEVERQRHGAGEGSYTLYWIRPETIRRAFGLPAARSVSMLRW